MTAEERATELSSEALLAWFRTMADKLGNAPAAARLLGVPKTTFDGWYAGRSRLPLEPVLKAAQLTGTSIDELVSGDTGQSPMAMSQVMTMDAVPPDGFVPVPMFDVRASAGNGLVPIDQQPREDVLSLRGDWLRSIGLVPGKAEAMFVTGDSMEPTIRDGDMILVDRTIDRVVDGGIYVLVVNGEVRVKRVFVRTNGSLLLQSDNDMWADEVVSADERTQLAIEGRVRWFGRLI